MDMYIATRHWLEYFSSWVLETYEVKWSEGQGKINDQKDKENGKLVNTDNSYYI